MSLDITLHRPALPLETASTAFASAPQQSSEFDRQLSENDRQLSANDRPPVVRGPVDRLVEYLVRRHPTKTAARVAAEAGCSRLAVEKWIERRSAPSFAAFLALVGAYGPDFLAEVMGEESPGWLAHAFAAVERQAIEAEIDARRARLASLGGAEVGA